MSRPRLRHSNGAGYWASGSWPWHGYIAWRCGPPLPLVVPRCHRRRPPAAGRRPTPDSGADVEACARPCSAKPRIVARACARAWGAWTHEQRLHLPGSAPTAT